MNAKGNILVVDDNPANLQLLVDTLTAEGYYVRPTDSGELALVSISVKAPDLILLDVRMPNMDGFELCQKIKSQKDFCDIPIMFISAAKESEERVKGLQLGAVDFISKPFQREELLARVNTHLELNRFRKKLEVLVKERTEKLELEISKHREAEEALIQSEIKFRNVFEHSVDAIGVSIKGIHKFVNPSYVYIFGYSYSEELIEKPVIDLIAPEERENISNNPNLCLNGILLAGNYETRGYRKDGTSFDMDVHVSTYTLNNDLYSLVILRDITIQKRTANEIKLLNEGLEQRVIERTAQLEAANKELEAFSYSVSHDLRAPLRHISGYANMLINYFEDIMPEKAKQYLNNIINSVSKMDTLINDLLMFSRTGRQELNYTKVDMNIVFSEVKEQIAPDILNRNIEWIIGDLPVITGDLNLLKLVCFNLLSNAVKFTQKKEVAKIEIGYKKDNKEFIFIIRDNGVGFDMQYENKLFGVFQRLHSNDEFEGTGIGLANVRRIIHRHGGKCWAEAEVDKGATFYFSLPQKQV